MPGCDGHGSLRSNQVCWSLSFALRVTVCNTAVLYPQVSRRSVLSTFRLCFPWSDTQVNLEKVQERWWEAVLTDEPKISVRKIDPTRPMTDLDDEAQAKIEELMYNERQKKTRATTVPRTGTVLGACPCQLTCMSQLMALGDELQVSSS